MDYLRKIAHKEITLLISFSQTSHAIHDCALVPHPHAQGTASSQLAVWFAMLDMFTSMNCTKGSPVHACFWLHNKLSSLPVTASACAWDMRHTTFPMTPEPPIMFFVCRSRGAVSNWKQPCPAQHALLHHNLGRLYWLKAAVRMLGTCSLQLYDLPSRIMASWCICLLLMALRDISSYDVHVGDCLFLEAGGRWHVVSSESCSAWSTAARGVADAAWHCLRASVPREGRNRSHRAARAFRDPGGGRRGGTVARPRTVLGSIGCPIPRRRSGSNMLCWWQCSRKVLNMMFFVDAGDH